MDRRSFFKLTAFAVSLPAFSGLAFAREGKQPPRVGLDDLPQKETDDAVVYHMMLTNMRNHLSAYDFDPFRIKLVLVANGAGVKFFMKTHRGTKWEKEGVDQESRGEAVLSLTV